MVDRQDETVGLSRGAAGGTSSKDSGGPLKAQEAPLEQVFNQPDHSCGSTRAPATGRYKCRIPGVSDGASFWQTCPASCALSGCAWPLALTRAQAGRALIFLRMRRNTSPAVRAARRLFSAAVGWVDREATRCETGQANNAKYVAQASV